MDLLAALHQRKGSKSGAEVKFLCVEHEDHTPSASYNVIKCTWFCQVCEAKGTQKSLILRLRELGLDVDFPETSGAKFTIQETYDYTDKKGEALFQVLRLLESGKKTFRQRRYLPGHPEAKKDGWVWSLKGLTPVLYHLKGVLEGIGTKRMIFVVEGEKDVHSLEALNLVATTNSMGAGKWRQHYAETLLGARVCIVPDFDTPGLKHALEVAASLERYASEIRVLELPNPEGKKGFDVSDWLKDGGTLEGLKALIKTTPLFDHAAPTVSISLPSSDTLPLDNLSTAPVDKSPNSLKLQDLRIRLLLKGDTHLWSQTVLRALEQLNQTSETPHLFQRERDLLRVVRVKDVPRLELLDDHSLREHIGARFQLLKEKDEVETPTELSKDQARRILSSETWPLPYLSAIVHNPVFSTGGRLVMKDGYDPSSELYMALKGLDVPEVPLVPDEGDLIVARDLILDELLGDFPFADAASRANSVALGLQPFVRPLIDGVTPLYLITASTHGTGKSLLAEAIGTVATGKTPNAIGESGENEEWKKLITALLLEGENFIFFDNINGRLDTSTLASALTSRMWKDRLLGKSQTISVPNMATWVLTANNPALSGEISRRGVWIHLDARVEQPWMRSHFKHHPIRPWLIANRPQLIWAFLTLIQNWVARGMPRGRAILGSFEEWAGVMSGILETAEIPGFLGNLDSMYERSDTDSEEWREFITQWWKTHGGNNVKASDLMSLARDHDLLLNVLGSGNDKSQQIKFGRALGGKNGRIYGSLRIMKGAMNTVLKSHFYRLENTLEQVSVASADFRDVGMSESYPELNIIPHEYGSFGMSGCGPAVSETLLSSFIENLDIENGGKTSRHPENSVQHRDDVENFISFPHPEYPEKEELEEDNSGEVIL